LHEDSWAPPEVKLITSRRHTDADALVRHRTVGENKNEVRNKGEIMKATLLTLLLIALLLVFVNANAEEKQFPVQWSDTYAHCFRTDLYLCQPSVDEKEHQIIKRACGSAEAENMKKYMKYMGT
jgi:hypothetical protein